LRGVLSVVTLGIDKRHRSSRGIDQRVYQQQLRFARTFRATAPDKGSSRDAM